LPSSAAVQVSSHKLRTRTLHDIDNNYKLRILHCIGCMQRLVNVVRLFVLIQQIQLAQDDTFGKKKEKLRITRNFQQCDKPKDCGDRRRWLRQDAADVKMSGINAILLERLLLPNDVPAPKCCCCCWYFKNIFKYCLKFENFRHIIILWLSGCQICVRMY
jgi:hypothetical protein